MKESAVIAQIAKSKATANRVAKALDSAVVDKAIANLTAANKTARTRDEEKVAKRRATAVKKLKNMMSQMGLSAEDIIDRKRRGKKKAAGSKTRSKKRGKVAPKYQLTVDGKTHRWTGRGRTPVVFRDYLGKGGTLDSCLIKK